MHSINNILVCYLWGLRHSKQLLVVSLKLVFSMSLRPLFDLELMSVMMNSHRVSVYSLGTVAPALLTLGLLEALLPTLFLISDIRFIRRLPRRGLRASDLPRMHTKPFVLGKHALDVLMVLASLR